MDVVAVAVSRPKNDHDSQEGEAPAEPTTDAETHGSAGASPFLFMIECNATHFHWLIWIRTHEDSQRKRSGLPINSLKCLQIILRS